MSFIEWTTNESYVESSGSIYVKFLDLLISIDQLFLYHYLNALIITYYK